MMKLTFTLAVALYAGFVIWGRPTDAVEAATAAADAPRPPAAAVAGDYDRPTILAAADAPGAPVTAPVTRTVVPPPAVIAASAPDPSATRTQTIPLGEPVRISLVQPPAAAGPAEPLQDAVADALADALDRPDDAARMVVTGSRVNVRAGPSTANAVVTSLPRGAEVVRLRETPEGWVELRDPASGVTGFMSANFLAPA